MPCTLETKPGVKWDVVPEIEAAQDTIAKAYRIAGAKAVVTSAHDGNHSHNSAHHQDDPAARASAIDLRITNLFKSVPLHTPKEWYLKVQEFARTLAAALNSHLVETRTPGRFDVVIEASHLHAEFSGEGEAPNILGFHSAQTVYPTQEVKGLMA